MKRRTGRVALQAAVIAEIHIDIEVDADGIEGDAQAQQRALNSQARREWDIISEAMARALRRHLIERKALQTGTRPAVGLLVFRHIANEAPEFLIKQLPGDDDGRS